MSTIQELWDLHDQVALVIGGSRGIGRSISIALAQAGAHVVVASRSKESVEAACHDVVAAGGRATGIPADVGRVEEVERLVREANLACGRIDVLVNSAGINPLWKRPEALEPDEWDLVMNVNLRGAFFACREVGKLMIPRRSGRIVNITSVTGMRGTVRGLPYTAAKAGLHALTQTLAADWAPHDIRVNAVASGFVETDLTSGVVKNPGLFKIIREKIPMGRFAQPEEMGGLVVYLASRASSYVTGQIFVVDGGYSSIR